MQARFIRRYAGLFACALPALAGAQQAAPQSSTPTPAPSDAAVQLAPVVVTASRVPQPLGDTLGDVSVISRDTLEQAGQSSLAEVLSREHGIEYVNYGGPQTVTSLFMRGANSNQTLVLIDGMRLNNATSGAAALNAIPADSIDHVEIVRGAASSLYGADAIGGVINIITRPDADKPLSAWVNAGVGSNDTQRYSAGLAGAADGWTYSLSTGYGQSKGFNVTTPDNTYLYNPDRDGYFESNVSGSLGYTWKPGQSLSVDYFYSRVNGGYDASSSPLFNDRSIQQLEGYAITSKNQLTDFWLSTLRLGSTVDNDESINAPGDLAYGNTPDGISVFRTRQNQLLWQNDLALATGQKLSLAYERLDQFAHGNIANYNDYPISFGDYTQTRRATDSFTAVYLGDFGSNHVQASLRNDNITGYNSQTTGGLSYGYDITRAVRASLSGNTGFRAPSFNELYWPNDGTFVGNPNLQPERSRNIEASLRYAQDDTEASVTLYRNRVSNLIIDEPIDPADPYSIYTPINVDHATLQGVTLAGSQRLHDLLGDLRLKASVDFTSPRDDDTGQTLPLRSHRVLRLSAEQRYQKLRVGTEWYLAGQRYNTDGSTLGGYSLFNLYAAYDLTNNVELSLRWNNVLDKQYTLVQGYATPGSTVFFNVGWRM